MMIKKSFHGLGFLSVVVFATTTLAAQPVKLECPTGTKQARSGNGKHSDIVACIKSNSSAFSPHGPTVYLYPNGERQADGMSEDGFRTGLWTFYNEKGEKTGNAMFKQSNFHGDVVELYENGKVKRVDHYVEGLKEGITKEYSADGKLVKQTEYRNNREVAVK